MRFPKEWRGCLINKDNTVLKASSITDIPKNIEIAVFNGDFTSKYHIVDMQIKGICKCIYNTTKGDEITEYEGIEFNSPSGSSIFNFSLIKPFLQKKSVIYLPGDNKPIIIQNKNYCVMVSPVLPDEFITDYTANVSIIDHDWKEERVQNNYVIRAVRDGNKVRIWDLFSNTGNSYLKHEMSYKKFQSVMNEKETLVNAFC